jgi:hypothetical protein
MKGFLGTGATFGADLNLVVQLIMGVALLAGVLLCEAKTLPSSWDLPNDRASVEFAGDRNGDVAIVPATTEAGDV